MSYNDHIDALINLLVEHPQNQRAANLHLSGYKMITSFDACEIFNRCPCLDIIFVYFRRQDGCDLNACFQRLAMNCKPSLALTPWPRRR